jgi:TnpA family transposase
LFFANRGEFRADDADEIMKKASCLSLLPNAVLVWNTLHIAEVVQNSTLRITALPMRTSLGYPRCRTLT